MAAAHVQGGGHRRTPSEAERWLEEVSKAVKAQQTPPPCPAIPTIPGPPSLSNQQQVSAQATPTVSLPKPLVAAPPTPASLPPMSVSSIPLIPGPPVTGPPMSLPSMSIPTMSAPVMSGAAIMSGGAAMIPPGSLPSSMQPFPLAFDATPAPVGLFSSPPLQPAFAPMQTYLPGLSSSMTYPNAGVVPVVGITPSQMVANVFCTAAGGGAVGSAGAGPKVGTLGQHHPNTVGFPALSAVNGLPPHGAALLDQHNGIPSGGSSSMWPPEGSQLTAPAPNNSQEDDRFEAQWAALEAKPAAAPPGNKTAAAPNPFANNLQKTFEIEL